MENRKKDTGFNASAEGAFTESGAWQITPRVWVSDDLNTGKRTALKDEAREQLLGRILDEALRGRVLGAERIHVLRSDGERITVIGPHEEKPEDPG
jgi:hypothetical protein